MFANWSTVLIHFIGAALVCAQLAYWSIRVMTAPPIAAPAAAKAVSVREPDASLVAREFGLIERASAGVSNIQVAGVYAAGPDSAAVMVVDDKPARAVLLGQVVATVSTLVDVDAQSGTIESGFVRRQLRVPSAPMASLSAPGPGNAFERRGNVLSAPSVEGGAPRLSTGRAAAAPPGMPRRFEPQPSPERGNSGASPKAQ
jgi:general secretion pathway protein C